MLDEPELAKQLEREDETDTTAGNSPRSGVDYNDYPRVICRYGRGCTHTDKAHKAAFWHPSSQSLTEADYHAHYICNECGLGFPNIQDLQLHLKRKTAWSDLSLVGCRISCLIDNKEWHEGFVSSLSSHGKHLVEFHLIGEQRWLNMKRIAFFIAERPPNPSSTEEQTQLTEDTGEYKEDNIILRNSDGLAPIEDMKDWIYVEDISLDYAFAQSVLFKVFGGAVQETGHKTRGHTCLTDGDKFNAKFSRGSLLYGELLPRGANKAFGVNHLDCSSARVLFDLGMGTGKIAIQAFLQFRNLEYVYGVELSEGRYQVAEEAVLRMASLLGVHSFHIQRSPGNFIILMEKGEGQSEEKCRVLHLERGNLFDTLNMELADVVMLETDIPSSTYPQLCHFLNQMHVGARTLSYLDLRNIWSFAPFNFQQLERNKHLSDRYPTSWSVQRGHHFFIWGKVSMAAMAPSPIAARGSGPSKSHKRSKQGREEEVEVVPAKSFGCFPTLSLFSVLLGRSSRINRTVIPRADSPEISAVPMPPIQSPKPRVEAISVEGPSSPRSSKARSSRSSSSASKRGSGSPREGGAKNDSPRRDREPAPTQNAVYTPRNDGGMPKMSDFALPVGVFPITGADAEAQPLEDMDVDIAAAAVADTAATSSFPEEKEHLPTKVTQPSPAAFPQMPSASALMEGVAGSSRRDADAMDTAEEEAEAAGVAGVVEVHGTEMHTKTPPRQTSAALLGSVMSVETTKSSLTEAAAAGLEIELSTEDGEASAVHAPLFLQSPLQAGERSPTAADSDTMNTPMHLKSAHPGENADVLDERRMDMISRQADFLASLSQQLEEATGTTETMSFVERQWDRSLIEPVTRQEKNEMIDPRINPELNGLSRRKASLDAKNAAAGVGVGSGGQPEPEPEPTLYPVKTKQSKKQRGANDESSRSGCAIS